MLNILSMENYRIRKNKSTYVVIFLTILIMLLSLYMANRIYVTKDKIKNEDKNIHFEIYPETKDDLSVNGDSYILVQYTNKTILLLMSIFAGIFFSAPYSHGFIKNFIGMKKKKCKYILSQYILGVIFTLILFIISNIIMIIGLPLISEGKYIVNDLGNLIKIISLQFLLHISFLSIILLISTITRSMSMTLMISLSYSFVLINFFVGIIDMILNKIFILDDDFTIGIFSPVNNISNLVTTKLNNIIISSILIIITCLLLSSVTIDKKDF